MKVVTNLPKDFITRMQELLGDSANEYFNSLTLSAVKGIRVNTLKTNVKEFLSLCDFSLTPHPTVQYGFIANGDKFGKTILHSAGLFYMQEPSAMTTAEYLTDYLNGISCPKVLDMCSAPGGKGTHLASILNERGSIVCNEYVYKRAVELVKNIERLGIKNAVVTCEPPSKIANAYGGAFDVVLADVPCSGEGMFRKEKDAVLNWSVSSVVACAKRGAEILRSCDDCLKQNGLLLYSTCTFSREENELNCESFAHERNYEIILSKRLYPHTFVGEGHFICLMKKKSSSLPTKKLNKPNLAPKSKITAFESVAKDCVHQSFLSDYTAIYYNDKMSLLPNSILELPNVNVLRAGIRCANFFTLKDNKPLPCSRAELHHHLAMVHKKDEAPNQTCVQDDDALKYLHGNEIPSCKNGMSIVSYHGFPLGFAKVSDGIAKNRLPKQLRFNS